MHPPRGAHQPPDQPWIGKGRGSIQIRPDGTPDTLPVFLGIALPLSSSGLSAGVGAITMLVRRVQRSRNQVVTLVVTRPGR